MQALFDMSREISCNLLSRQDLVANGAVISYAHGVKDAELWRAIGAELARRRQRAGHPSADAFRKASHGSPATNTLMAIERGRPGRIANIDGYCRALGTTTADVFRAVLVAADGLGPSFTDAELALVELSRAIPDGKPRAAWIELGRFVAEKAEQDRARLDGA